MVSFVGAGCGAADLITVRGMRLLQEADLVIYAGSLVNPELLSYTKKGCECLNSAYMTLDEVIDALQKGEEEGKKMVEDAKAEALRVTSEAELRCDSLQHEYDRILMDVTGFKAEIMKMYRKHMELLAALPPKEIVEAEEISEDQENEKDQESLEKSANE